MANIVYNYNNSNSDINVIQDVPKTVSWGATYLMENIRKFSILKSVIKVGRTTLALLFLF